jgi:hypothetical protein
MLLKLLQGREADTSSWPVQPYQYAMTGVAWTAEEDEQLKRLVDEHGTKK